jgi:heme/copper-type cytochrome/quinol oxidase subunit 1
MDNLFLPLPKHQQTVSRLWLITAVTTIIFAEIFALFLAASRTPGVYQFLPHKDFFYISLVTHVTLSLVMWFLAVECFYCSLSQIVVSPPGILWKLTTWGGFISTMLGIVIVVLAPFLGAENPVISNYIPVLNHPLFFVALSLFFIGVTLTMITPWIVSLGKKQQELLPDFSFGVKMVSATYLVAMITFLVTFQKLDTSLTDQIYFETLFWGAGHVMQFFNSIAMLTSWIFLAHVLYRQTGIFTNWNKILLALMFIFSLPAPILPYIYELGSQELTDSYTFLMRWGMGLSTGLIGLSLVGVIYKERQDWRNPLFSSLVFSIGLFAYGGILGTTINHYIPNVKIPSHYHAVIGAVTLSFMGVCYAVLPLFGRKLVITKWVQWQPVLCGLGGILFVSGMYWAGLYNVSRKTAGSLQGLDNIHKIVGMGVMGLGGLITLSGIIIFLYIFLRTIGKNQKEVTL